MVYSANEGRYQMKVILIVMWIITMIIISFKNLSLIRLEVLFMTLIEVQEVVQKHLVFINNEHLK